MLARGDCPAAPLRRRRWHLRAGEAIAAAPAPDPDAVAAHFQRSGDARAELWLERAAERARGAFIWSMAGDNQSFKDMDFVPMGDLK